MCKSANGGPRTVPRDGPATETEMSSIEPVVVNHVYNDMYVEYLQASCRADSLSNTHVEITGARPCPCTPTLGQRRACNHALKSTNSKRAIQHASLYSGTSKYTPSKQYTP